MTTVLIRMDKIGDLILTLPVDQVFLPTQQVVWFISRGLEYFPTSASPKRQFHSFSKKFSWKDFKQMVSTLRSLRPSQAIIFHAPWWVGLALCIAGVPKRIGVRSKPHSYIFFNRSLRQKRSRAQKHEAEYGLELVRLALGQGFDFHGLEPLKLKSSLDKNELKGFGVSDHYIVVHPGMAGSALNWPAQKYIQFIRYFSKTYDVVITCGPNDHSIVNPIAEALKENSKVKVLTGLSFDQLTLVLENARGVLAPSTGVVHMAASVGVPTLGIYSPVGVERAIRWGPRGSKVHTLTPETKNNTFDPQTVMDSLGADQVINKFKEML